MRKLLMLSTASIALALFSGTAMAQTSSGQSNSAGPAAASPSNSPKGGSISGADKGSSATSPESAQGHDSKSTSMPVGKGNTTSEDVKPGSATRSSDHAGSKNEKNASDKDRNSSHSDRTTNGREDTTDHKEKSSTSNKSNASDSRTSGNAATSAKVAPPAEKRSQIVSAIKQEKVSAVTNVTFNVSVGTRVPSSLHFYPVPERVVAIYPEWRGYEFILVHGRYIIVQPETHEIVYIIEG